MIEFKLFSILGAHRSFEIRYAAHFLFYFAFFVLACLHLPYNDNDLIFWIFPVVLCHAFCM